MLTRLDWPGRPMRYLVLSDIHGNLDAFETVLGTQDRVDGHLVLGDIVGYGAEPNAVITRVDALAPAAIIRGNHDKVAAGIELPESFNPAALRAAAWTQDALTPAHRAWLEALPAGPVIVDDLVEICHGSPDHEDEYIFSAADARLAFAATQRPVCFFGHTHVPACYWIADEEPGDVYIEDVATDGPMTLVIEPGRRYLINPGAVGQPRDGDPRAAYAVYDSEARTLTLARTEYDVEQAQRRIRDAGLPDILARRLAVGR
jgi:diadenosine tetraphosphatase ApaH/serine/threonine PP2A family protein phosphatase